ncbi:MAG TPA: diguanylate cyclase [Pyrinomonadaceae bacterium]|nr:diguanylate cyclase [Pyrinomonadaceae bacterium]
MSATARTPGTPAREQGRVLIVADDPSIGRYKEAFEGEGFSVVGISAGRAALVALQRTRPHLVVAHTKVRGVTADELRLVLDASHDQTPLLLIGEERADTETRARAIASGAFDYFQMPEETELLLARTSQLIAIRQMIDSLRAEADRDYLTGLANRRRFRGALGKELERWRRYNVPCALLLVDVDHLKKINDAYGHPAGDMVIRGVAAALTELSRDNDTAARLGGEEFALLLAGADGASAFAAAERLRQTVESTAIQGVGSYTVSLGVAACPVHAQSERALFTASDTALYQAKRDGRNRTVVAPPLG